MRSLVSSAGGGDGVCSFSFSTGSGDGVRSFIFSRFRVLHGVVKIPTHKLKQGETRRNTGIHECTPREN